MRQGVFIHNGQQEVEIRTHNRGIKVNEIIGVVDLVRNACNQHSKRGQLLALYELPVHHSRLRDVMYADNGCLRYTHCILYHIHKHLLEPVRVHLPFALIGSGIPFHT